MGKGHLDVIRRGLGRHQIADRGCHGAGQPTLLVPYATLEGDTDIYDLSTNLYFDPAKTRVLSGDGAAYDTALATSAKLPVKPVINGNGCNLFGAVTTDRHTGKVFYAQFNTDDDSISVISLPARTGGPPARQCLRRQS